MQVLVGNRVGRRVLPFMEGACSANHRGSGASTFSPWGGSHNIGHGVVLRGWGGECRRPEQRLRGATAGWSGVLAKGCSQGLALAIAGGSC